MKKIMVLGAGAIGTLTARELVVQGHEVTLVSRSGTNPEITGLRAIAADATDALALDEAALTRGRAPDVVVNALNPASYTAWAEDWPPMWSAITRACRNLGAGQVLVGNLYSYGRVDAPFDESHPVAPNGVKGRVRAGMWEDALANHEAGVMPAVEVRASDYFGPTRPGVSLLMDYVIRPIAGGRTAWVPVGDLDAQHSWTFLPDIARLVAEVAAADPTGPRWGRAWHVPTAAPVSMRKVAHGVALLTGHRARIRPVPKPLMSAARVLPLIRALDETKHQFEYPWVMQSSDAQAEFGWAPTPWDQALSQAVDSLRPE